jgi:hypothetical protein
MIQCLTGGVCSEFSRMFKSFKELHTIDDSVKKLSSEEYMKYKLIETVVQNTHDFDDKRRSCRSAIKAHYRNPTNEFIVFECLEWLKSIDRDLSTRY